MCDKCGKSGKTFKYNKNGMPGKIDLCVNCLQDFVLTHKVKLEEVTDDGSTSNKGIIHG